MDWKTYQRNVFDTLSSFDATFRPHNKWQDVKLSAICPCNTCEVSKELMARQYEIQMSGGLQEEITKPCEHCLDAVLWKAECVQKLAWYEEHDERLK